MDRSTPTLRHAGTLATDAGRFAKVEAQLPQVPSTDAWQLQAAIRTELDRQTRQLEETLAKQAKVALEKHSQEVQGVAAAWQLVARALGEQLQAGFRSTQRSCQEQAERLELLEAYLRRTLQESEEREAHRRQEVQGVGDAWQTLARTIGDQLGQVQRLGHRLEAGVQELSDNFEKGAPRSPRRLKSQPTSPKASSIEATELTLDSPVSKQSEEVPRSTVVETEELPGTVLVEAQSPTSKTEGNASMEKMVSQKSRTKALQRSSTANDNALTFAEMQKQYGVKGKAMQTFIEEQDSGICCLRRWSIAIVSHRRFEMVCASLVILCAAMIGIEADYEIRSGGSGQHPVFRGFDIAFNTWFAAELALRWTSEGLRPFFSCENPAVKWNIMDCCLVISSALEEIAALLAAASFLEVSTLLMLRMMRLVRVARVIRMLRFFSDLRVMVNGIMGSTKPLLWACVFLLILMFMVGVTFMQLASNYIKEMGGSQEELIMYWGSLSRTMMTLYMAISGGIDWQDCVRPLRMVSEALEYMFATYVFFTIFCCLNIVTGIFVDNAKALKGADEDAMYLEALTERKRWIADIKDLFIKLAHINGQFTLEDFKEQMYNIKVQTLFRKLGINLDGINAEELWDILDADQSGCIDEEEFAKGLKFFQGPAQSIHVYRLMREGSKLHDKVERLTEVCHEILEQQKLHMPE